MTLIPILSNDHHNKQCPMNFFPSFDPNSLHLQNPIKKPRKERSENKSDVMTISKARKKDETKRLNIMETLVLCCVMRIKMGRPFFGEGKQAHAQSWKKSFFVGTHGHERVRINDEQMKRQTDVSDVLL